MVPEPQWLPTLSGTRPWPPGHMATPRSQQAAGPAFKNHSSAYVSQRLRFPRVRAEHRALAQPLCNWLLGAELSSPPPTIPCVQVPTSGRQKVTLLGDGDFRDITEINSGHQGGPTPT